MSLWKSWEEYYRLTKNKPPRKLLVKALPFVFERGSALDLGAGALNDSQYLLSEGFQHVTAEDKESIAAEIANELPTDRFAYVVNGMEDFDFPTNTYDLVNAQYSLPFIGPEQFKDVWEHIRNSMKHDAIFTGQLFGERDEWVGNERMSFHTKSDVESLLRGLEILTLEEEEDDKATAAGIMKHWHVFHFIVRAK